MNGKLVGSAIVLLGLSVGAIIYYLQVYGYYHDVAPTGARDVQLVTQTDGHPQPIVHADFRAIDADSSPIRYRACFTTTLTLDEARELYVTSPDVSPRNAPGWFDCFDAAAIGAELSAGTATTFLGHKNIAYGVDRLVVITAQGQGFVWQTLNECGTKDYSGTVVGEICPPRPAASK